MTAVTAAPWAVEFDARPSLASAAIVAPPLASVATRTLTLLLAVFVPGGAR